MIRKGLKGMDDDTVGTIETRKGVVATSLLGEKNATPCEGKTVETNSSIEIGENIVEDIEIVGDKAVATRDVGDGYNSSGGIGVENGVVEGSRKKVFDAGVGVDRCCGLIKCEMQYDDAIATADGRKYAREGIDNRMMVGVATPVEGIAGRCHSVADNIGEESDREGGVETATAAV